MNTQASQAVLMTGPHEPLVVESIPVPTMQDGDVLLRTVASEVCGTDVHLWEGQLAGVPFPIIPGHVSVGDVVEVSGAPTDAQGNRVVVGSRVTFLDVFGSCGQCYYCAIAKASTRCPDRRVYGVTVSSNEGPFGGWSEYIYLPKGVQIFTLPDRIEWQDFMAGGCGLVTAVHGVERAEIGLGDTVVVQGSGPVGLSMVALAQLRGAGQIITVGGPKHRLEMATKLGSDIVIDIAGTSAEERESIVMEKTRGRGADIVLEATGVAGAVTEGLNFVRSAGTYVVVGQYTDAGDISLNPHLDINKKHVRMLGCWGSDASHLHRALSVLQKYDHVFAWRSMIQKEYTLSQASEALDDIAHHRIVKAVIRP